MGDFVEFKKSNLNKVITLLIIVIFSIGVLCLFYQGSLESLAATTLINNISTDGTLSIGGSATTSGSLYIANDLTILSGNVGIGTTSPDALLDIGKTAASHNDLFMISSSTAGDLLTIDRSGNVTATAFIGDGSELTNISIAWDVSGDDVYKETGNVGIGTTTPTELLTLSGGNFRQIPVNPVLKGSLGIGGTPYSVYVSGRYAYVVDAGSDDLKVIDISDPTNPTLMGSMSLGANPFSVYVSGRYAYVVDYGSDDLKVIDVSDPTNPTLAGSVSIGAHPNAVFVSGRYAYVVDNGSDDLKVIDISDPTNPTTEGSIGLGPQPVSVFVSGRYAYTVDYNDGDLDIIDISDSANPTLVGNLVLGTSGDCRAVYVSGRYAYVVDERYDDLKIIDISDPDDPSIEASLAIGSYPTSVFVSGRYAYVVDISSTDLKVIDISDPTSPNLAGSLGIGTSPFSVFVSGRYAYVVDTNSDDLKVIDISGMEAASMMAHSLEAGNLQVRNDIIAQGQLQITGGATIGTGGLSTIGHIGIYASSSAPALKAVQHLTGDIFNLFDGSTEVFTVLDGGNVGIGTTTPGVTLDIDNGTATTTIEVGDALTGGKGACLKFRDGDDAGWTYCSVLDGSMSCSADSCE